MIILERIIIRFANINTKFPSSFTSLISTLGRTEDHVFKLASSGQNFYPEISLDFQSKGTDILTDFIFSDNEIISVKVENSTGLQKQSPYSYKYLSIETVNHRFVSSGVKLCGVDHVGINLPWFSSDLHPRILQLREELSSRCLYHRFPTGEPWDFIIPGSIDEIVNRKAVDYTKTRRPKFELVSFNSTSRPLVQFDIGVNMGYEKFSQLFPEALNDSQFRNIWVYLESPFSVDICLVVNEYTERDWSNYFEGFKIER